jgi:hypothetical protein
MLDALSIAKKQEDTEDGRVSFEVHPDELYPAAIEAVRAEVAKNLDADDVPKYLRQHYIRARRIDKDAWEAALKSKEECPPDLIEARVEALEVARLWFTAELHQAVEKVPMHLHILKGEKWRL